MNLSFPESSQEKMEHRYALFNDPGPTARLPIRRRRIEFNEREITAARSRGSNLGLSSIRARQPESGVLDFQAVSSAAERDLEAGRGSVKGSIDPER